MRKKLYVLLIGFCLASISACGNNSQVSESNSITSLDENAGVIVEDASEQIENAEEKGVEVSNSGNGLIVVPGTYEIGDYVANANYLITCEDTDYSMRVIVFESKDNYDNYQKGVTHDPVRAFHLFTGQAGQRRYTRNSSHQ